MAPFAVAYDTILSFGNFSIFQKECSNEKQQPSWGSRRLRRNSAVLYVDNHVGNDNDDDDEQVWQLQHAMSRWLCWPGKSNDAPY